MITYSYKARDRNGELISGVLDAEDERAVSYSLDSLGYSVIEIAPRARASAFSRILDRIRPLKKQEVIIFTRQLATLLRSGIPLSTALSTVCDQNEDKKFRAILEDVRQSVQGGLSFSESLARHPDAFSELFVNMVKVGETGGMLDRVLDRLSAAGSREIEMVSRIRSALVYPAVLVAVAFCVVSFLIVGVLPKFAMVFRASHASLPLPTQVVLGVSVVLRKAWLFLLLGLILGLLALRKYVGTEKGRFKFHNWLLGLPVFGKLYTKIQVSAFARSLSLLTSSGIPILQGLLVVEKTVTNVVIRRAIQNIRLAITEGRSLVEPFKVSGYFSPMVVQMIATGEKSGQLDQVLSEIASFYDPEIEYTIKNLTALLEPFMLLAMGILVAFIALSVLLPIFNLIKVFRG